MFVRGFALLSAGMTAPNPARVAAKHRLSPMLGPALVAGLPTGVASIDYSVFAGAPALLAGPPPFLNKLLNTAVANDQEIVVPVCDVAILLNVVPANAVALLLWV